MVGEGADQNTRGRVCSPNRSDGLAQDCADRATAATRFNFGWQIGHFDSPLSFRKLTKTWSSRAPTRTREGACAPRTAATASRRIVLTGQPQRRGSISDGRLVILTVLCHSEN